MVLLFLYSDIHIVIIFYSYAIYCIIIFIDFIDINGYPVFHILNYNNNDYIFYNKTNYYKGFILFWDILRIS